MQRDKGLIHSGTLARIPGQMVEFTQPLDEKKAIIADVPRGETPVQLGIFRRTWGKIWGYQLLEKPLAERLLKMKM